MRSKNRSTRTRIRIATAVVSMALLSSVMLPTPANAITFGLINCTLSVQWPHGSTHVNGTVNVVSVATCSKTMREIYVRSTLHKGSRYWQGSPADKFNVAVLSANAATSCSFAPGNFYGSASAVFHPPFGYSPSSGVVQASGATKPVVCKPAGPTAGTATIDQTAVNRLRAEGFTVTIDADTVTVSKQVVFAEG